MEATDIVAEYPLSAFANTGLALAQITTDSQFACDTLYAARS